MVVTSPRRRIDLDDIEMVWRVEKGQASVQVEPAPQSGLPRACETLLRVDEGGFVFGMSSKTMPDKGSGLSGDHTGRKTHAHDGR